MSGDDLDYVSKLINEAARHLRSCAKCRKSLKEFAGPAAKYALAEVEHEMDRELTGDEKRLLAKTTAVLLSRGLAAQAFMAHDAAPVMEAIERAVEDAARSQINPFSSLVGEA